jgi:hypothetical protein
MTEEQEKPAGGEAAEVPAAAEPGVAALVVEQQGDVTSAVMMAAQGDSALVAGIIADDEGVLAEGAIGIEGQDAVIVASFADMELATQTYQGLLAAEQAGRLDIEGVLVAKADETGKVEIVKMTDHKTATASWPARSRASSRASSSRRPSSPARRCWAPAAPPSARSATSWARARWPRSSPP